MAKKEFNLASLIGDSVSNLDTIAAREQIEYIDIDLLDDDARNFYELTGLDELAANIELFGLQQPLRVRPNPDEAGRFVIVSGHRRRAACRLLVDDGKDKFRQIACIRERGEASEALQELRLIYANSDTRKLTPAEISRQAERVEALLYQLKEEGYEFPGRMRDHVAEACKVSKSKLARLKVIREGLSSDFMDAFEKNKLVEQSAYAIARLPLDFQHRLFKVAPAKDLRGTAVEYIQRMYGDGKRWEPQMTCPNGKPCTHGDAALRHDIDNPFSPCCGERCCLTCSAAIRDWSPCERMCSKAKAKREAEKEEKEKREAADLRKRANKYQLQTQANAQRLLKAIDASGVSDSVLIKWDYYGASIKVSEIREYAQGKFNEADNRWYAPRLAPEALRHPIDAATKLGCSADYLLGLTDELSPGSKSVADAVPWYPRSVAPEDGAHIITVDGRYVDDGIYSCGEMQEDCLNSWDDVELWTYVPKKGVTFVGEPSQALAENFIPLQWLPGEERPAKDGQKAFCKFMCEGMDKPLERVAVYDMTLGEWRFPSGGSINAECVGWFPLPED